MGGWEGVRDGGREESVQYERPTKLTDGIPAGTRLMWGLEERDEKER